MLEIRNLKITYGASDQTVCTVVGLNLLIAPGTMAMLAGRNGSGKSSLLRVLAGLQEPQEGEVLIQGKSLNKLQDKEIADMVSIMFSSPPQIELSTVGEVVLTSMQRFFSPFKLGFEKEWDEVQRCLGLCGMQAFIQRRFDSLSDGEKQKVMLARSLAQNTPVLLLDEPLAFLDYPSRKELLLLIEKLAKQEGKIILFSSHDLDISLMHCDMLLLLQGNGAWKLEDQVDVIQRLVPMDLF